MKLWEKEISLGKTFCVCDDIFLIGLCLVKMLDGRLYNNSDMELVGICLSVVGAMLGFSLGCAVDFGKDI